MQLRTLKPLLPSGPDFARAKAFLLDLGFDLQWQVEGVAAARGIAALVLSIASLGCEPMLVTSPAGAVCTEAGVQCQLPAGPLGVCERSPCPPGASPPCFACVSQH